MNITRWTAATVICHSILFAGLLASSQAQTKVVLVDIGQVFKNHPQFSAGLAVLKSKADQFQAEGQQIQQQLIAKAEALDLDYDKESDEYRDREALLAKESATMEVDQRSKMRELLKQEAQLHFDTYVEISQVVSQYCQEFGIQLVLRFNREEMDPNNPNSIMQRVNGGVVFHSQSADITNAVIQRIAQGRRQAANSDIDNR